MQGRQQGKSVWVSCMAGLALTVWAWRLRGGEVSVIHDELRFLPPETPA